MPTRYFHRHPSLLIPVILFLLHFTTAAEVGYGPDFDPCGDNCQTQMVSFCTVDHNIAQMRTCWCEDTEYIKRMDACLSSCDPAVSDTDKQRDQMLRYRNFVCEPSAGLKDTEFANYYRTRFASVDGGFVPEVTRGIPPPTATPRAIVTMSTSSTSSSGGDTSYTSLRPSSTLPTTAKPTINPTSTSVSTATSTASSYVTALPSTTAGPDLLKTGLTTIQLVSIIIGVAVLSIVLSLCIVYYIRRRRGPRRPIWNPPPPPPLPRPSPSSFLPYYYPASPPPPTATSRGPQDLEPHAITTSTSSIYSSREGGDSIVSPSRERGRYSYFPRESPIPSPAKSEFQKYLQPKSASSVRILTPVITPPASTMQITSASAIAAAAAAAQKSNRNSASTIIEPEPQQAIVQETMTSRTRSRSRSKSRSRSRSRPRGSTRRSRRDTAVESEYCGEDDCTSCESWSERSWYEEDANWWDLRESTVMGPSV